MQAFLIERNCREKDIHVRGLSYSGENKKITLSPLGLILRAFFSFKVSTFAQSVVYYLHNQCFGLSLLLSKCGSHLHYHSSSNVWFKGKEM